MKSSNKILLAAVLLSVAVTGPAYSQGYAAAGDSVCIHFSGDSRDLFVQLQRGPLLSGTLPLTLCNLEPGLKYDMTVRGYGFEVRRGYLFVRDDGTVSVKGNRMATAFQNLIPGLGSVRAERKGAGWTDMSSIVVGGLISYRENREYKHINNRYTILMTQLKEADTVEESRKIRIDANKASRDLNVQNTHRKRIIGYTAYMYAFQLIDPWLVGNPPRASVDESGTVVEIRGAGSSTVKAALLSLVRPGRGQFCQGKTGRGSLFSLATTIGVYVSLEYLNKYDEAVNLYELNIEYFNTAETVEDKEYFSSRSDAYWTDVDKTRRWKNISFGILAGVWAAGIVDTFIPGREDAPPNDISLDIGPRHAALVYRF